MCCGWRGFCSSSQWGGDSTDHISPSWQGTQQGSHTPNSWLLLWYHVIWLTLICILDILKLFSGFFFFSSSSIMWRKIIEKKKVPGRELKSPLFWEAGFVPTLLLLVQGQHEPRSSFIHTLWENLCCSEQENWESFLTDDGSQGQEKIVGPVGPVVTFWRSHILFAQILRALSPQPILGKMMLFHFEWNFPPWYFVPEPTFSTQNQLRS